jgi:hypothetical protein
MRNSAQGPVWEWDLPEEAEDRYRTPLLSFRSLFLSSDSHVAAAPPQRFPGAVSATGPRALPTTLRLACTITRPWPVHYRFAQAD